MWHESDFAVIALLLVGTLVLGATFIPIILGFRHARRTRELDHAERMKALEVGRPMPGEGKNEPSSNSSRIALSIGAGVPIGVFGCAWLTSTAAGYHESIWIASALVGTAGVVCGSILAALSIKSEKSSAKPVVEEDAYDVVASRG